MENYDGSDLNGNPELQPEQQDEYVGKIGSHVFEAMNNYHSPDREIEKEVAQYDDSGEDDFGSNTERLDTTADEYDDIPGSIKSALALAELTDAIIEWDEQQYTDGRQYYSYGVWSGDEEETERWKALKRKIRKGEDAETVRQNVESWEEFKKVEEKIKAADNSIKNIEHMSDIGMSYDINTLIDNASKSVVGHNISSLLSHGADAQKIVDKVHPNFVLPHLKELRSAGANIDIDKVVEGVVVTNSRYRGIRVEKDEPYGSDGYEWGEREAIRDGIKKNLGCLISLPKYAELLVAEGANANKIAERMAPPDALLNKGLLEKIGVTIDVPRLLEEAAASDYFNWIHLKIDELLFSGIDAKQLINVLNDEDKLSNFQKLQDVEAAGMDVDAIANRLMFCADEHGAYKLSSFGEYYISDAVANGADISKMIEKAKGSDRAADIWVVLTELSRCKEDSDEDTGSVDLEQSRFNVGKICTELLGEKKFAESFKIFSRRNGNNGIDFLLKEGVDTNIIIESIPYHEGILESANELLRKGADIRKLLSLVNDPNDLVSYLDDEEILNNIDALVHAGAVIDVDKIITEKPRVLLGVNIGKLLSSNRFNKYELMRHLPLSKLRDNYSVLKSHGISDEDILSAIESRAASTRQFLELDSDFYEDEDSDSNEYEDFYTH